MVYNVKFKKQSFLQKEHAEDHNKLILTQNLIEYLKG